MSRGSRWRGWLAGLGWVSTAAVAVRGVTGTFNARSSLAWLQAGPAHPGHRGRAAAGARPWLVLVVPLLREERIAAETIRVFAELARRYGQASVVLATTERDYHEPPVEPGSVPTPELVRELVGDLAAEGGGQVRQVHYPDQDGVMVHQVNHAAQAELARLAETGLPPAQVWVAVYNADSRPDPATLDAVAALITESAPPPRIIQQSAVFTTNLAAHTSPVTAGAALLQSRWTLAREIPRLRRQARHARTGGGGQAGTCGARWPHLAHCVGHGLFLRGEVFTEHGGLPTEPMNEDLAFGFWACAAGVPIQPLPLLEHGDHPTSIPGIIRQARQWFWSYAEYPLAARLAAARGAGTPRTRAWLLTQGLARGGLWLGQSPVLAATLLLPLVARHRLLAAAAVAGAVGVYAVVPVVWLAHAERARDHPIPLGGRELAGVLAAGLLASVGPWWCLGNAVHRRLTGATYHHDKTER